MKTMSYTESRARYAEVLDSVANDREEVIITRAGQGTKIIFTGDIYQIDTPYLDAQSNGLSYLIDKVKHHSIYAHVRLEKGERSELANLANDLL